jgi:glycosyltransferase involved in cell wall biosynthesis
MRVANIIEDARIGGPQIRNLKVAKALKSFFDVTLVFPKKNSKALIKQCKLLDIKYLSLSLTAIKSNFIGFFLYVFFFLIEAIKLAQILKKNKFDIVHVSGGCWQTKGIFAAKLAGIKSIWELNDTYSPAIVRVFFFFLSHLANGFIFASYRTKKYYRKLIPSKRKSLIIQSPVDINFFDPNLDYSAEKFIKDKINEKKIIIGTVANLNPNKDLVTLLKVAKKISKYSNKVIFIFVGPIYQSQKKYFEHLKYIIKCYGIRNFFFLNKRDDVRCLLKAMDIYICTSKNESSPLAIWEAMSMQKAIVSTDVGDVRKFIKNGSNGFVTKVGNINNLAKSIIKLIEKPKLRKEFGKISRQIAYKNFNLKMCANFHKKAFKIIFKSRVRDHKH